MNTSYEQADKGRLPDKTPCEVYCHTLTDETILSPDLRERGFHTITLFGLDAPYSLFTKNHQMVRKQAEKKFLGSMNHALEEPLEDCLAVRRRTRPCRARHDQAHIRHPPALLHR